MQKARRADFGRHSSIKNVSVGHSVSSALNQGVAAKYSQGFDSLILQGIPTNFNYSLMGFIAEDQHIAITDPSGRFKDLAEGYHTPSNGPLAPQVLFYRYPKFESKSEPSFYLFPS